MSPLGYTNRLVVDPGAVFINQVDGGNAIGGAAVSTLELAGTTAGTLSGIGVQFTDFVQTTIDAGADWTRTGSNDFAAGTTLGSAGTLAILDTTVSDTAKVINDGTLLVDQSTLSLGSLTGTGEVGLNGGTFSVSGSIATTETIDFAGPSSLFTINALSFTNPIDNFVNGDTIELTGVTDGETVKLVNTDTLQNPRRPDRDRPDRTRRHRACERRVRHQRHRRHHRRDPPASCAAPASAPNPAKPWLRTWLSATVS